MNAVATAFGMWSLRDAGSTNLIFFGNTEEVISRLKFIGHIQQDEKINAKYVYREPDTVFTRISRTFIYKDNRKNSLQFIRDVISRSFEIIDLQMHRKEMEQAKAILIDLLKAKTGISHLRQTYVDDTKFCCDMDVILESINTKLKSLEKQGLKEDQQDQCDEKTSKV